MTIVTRIIILTIDPNSSFMLFRSTRKKAESKMKVGMKTKSISWMMYNAGQACMIHGITRYYFHIISFKWSVGHYLPVNNYSFPD